MKKAMSCPQNWSLSVFVSAVKLFSYVATDFLFVIFATLNFSDNQLSQREL